MKISGLRKEIHTAANQKFIEFSVIHSICKKMNLEKKNTGSSELRIFLAITMLGDQIYRDLKSPGSELRMKKDFPGQLVYSIASISRVMFEGSIWLCWILNASSRPLNEFRKNLYILSGYQGSKRNIERAFSLQPETEVLAGIKRGVLDSIGKIIDSTVKSLCDSPEFMEMNREQKKVIKNEKQVPKRMLPLAILKSKHHNSKKYLDYERLSFYAHLIPAALPDDESGLVSSKIMDLTQINEFLRIANEALATSLALVMKKENFDQMVSSGRLGALIGKNVSKISF